MKLKQCKERKKRNVLLLTLFSFLTTCESKDSVVYMCLTCVNGGKKFAHKSSELSFFWGDNVENMAWDISSQF